MGSGASKTAKETAAAAAAASQRAVKSAMSRQQAPPPSAAPPPPPPPSMERGFTRGEGPTSWRDQEQERYLQAKTSTAPTELPQDLLDFLKEAGPLEKRLDRQLTSPRLVHEWEKEEKKSGQDAATTIMRDRLDAQERALRRRQRMPLVEQGDYLALEKDDLDNENAPRKEEDTKEWLETDNEVQMTMRTTNFSEGAQDEQDVTHLSFGSLQMYQMLLPKPWSAATQHGETPQGTNRMAVQALLEQQQQASLATLDKSSLEESVEKVMTEWKQRLASANKTVTASQEEATRRDVTNLFQYTEVPTLMYDSDDTTLLGVSQDRVPLLLLQKLTMVPSEHFEWTLQKEEEEEEENST